MHYIKVALYTYLKPKSLQTLASSYCTMLGLTNCYIAIIPTREYYYHCCYAQPKNYALMSVLLETLGGVWNAMYNWIQCAKYTVSIAILIGDYVLSTSAVA